MVNSSWSFPPYDTVGQAMSKRPQGGTGQRSPEALRLVSGKGARERKGGQATFSSEEEGRHSRERKGGRATFPSKEDGRHSQAFVQARNSGDIATLCVH